MTNQLICGARIKDNDPRMPNRVLVVTRVGNTRVSAQLGLHDGTGQARISKKYIHLDDKVRRSGWTVLPAEAQS